MNSAWRRLRLSLTSKKNLLVWLGLAAIMAVSFQITQARSLSLHFVDEEDHIAFAYYINRGYQLHRDLQSNHQPLVYFGSAAIQKLTQPDNIFMLIRRHRQAMFVYGLAWSLIFVWRFKTLGMVFVLFFEFLKYFLLGNILLMETLAVYPAVYLLAVMLEAWTEKLIPSNKELMFLGVGSFLIIFNLVPLWPWLLLVWFGYWLRLKKRVFWLLPGLAVGVLALFWHYSPLDWFRETVRNNFLYVIPDLSPLHSTSDWLKMVFFPFLAFFTKQSLQAKFIAMFFTGWLVSLVYLIKVKNKHTWLIGFLYLFLVLANNRVLSPGAVYYHGFHLLPWLGLMIWVFVSSLWFLFKNYPYVKKYFVPVFVVWSLMLMANKNMPYFLLNTDVEHEYYVNYSMLDDINFAIKTLVSGGDRLAVTANEPLIYWQSGANLATRQVIYGGWEPKVKELNDTYNRVFFGDNPPEIIYGSDEPQLLAGKYANIQRHGKPTELFVRKDKFAAITDAQWQALATRGFEHF